jgi:hypothetical protein
MKPIEPIRPGAELARTEYQRTKELSNHFSLYLCVSFVQCNRIEKFENRNRSAAAPNTGQTMRASPMSYAVDGVQYLAVATGSDAVGFSLPFESRPD